MNPPMGMPVWRMPMARPRRRRGKASRMSFPPAGVGVAEKAPMISSATPSPAAGVTEASSPARPVAIDPPSKITRSPMRSTARPEE